MVDDACLDLKPLSGREIGDICPDGGRNEHLLRVGHSSGFFAAVYETPGTPGI